MKREVWKSHRLTNTSMTKYVICNGEVKNNLPLSLQVASAAKKTIFDKFKNKNNFIIRKVQKDALNTKPGFSLGQTADGIK